MKHIQFTQESADRLIKAYNKARKDGLKEFTFDGNEYVTDYAYYMIQYMIMQKAVTGTFDQNKIFTKTIPA
jgi:hypothetical protein